MSHTLNKRAKPHAGNVVYKSPCTASGTSGGVIDMLDEFVDRYDPDKPEQQFGCTMIDGQPGQMPDCLGCGKDSLAEFDGDPLEWARLWRTRLQDAENKIASDHQRWCEEEAAEEDDWDDYDWHELDSPRY